VIIVEVGEEDKIMCFEQPLANSRLTHLLYRMNDCARLCYMLFLFRVVVAWWLCESIGTDQGTRRLKHVM
jgi:hypothetical protein